MNVKISDVYSCLCKLAPLSLQLDYDNSGLLIGCRDDYIRKILLSLDITEDVVKEAMEQKANLIISHHPVIFHPLKDLSDRPENRKLFLMLKNNISAICMHTNLDIAEGGVNDVLLDCFSAKKISVLSADGCGRIGELDREYVFSDFLQICKRVLKANGLRYTCSGNSVRRIAVMGGFGAYAIYDAYKQGCDTYITGDLRYHDFLLAAELKMNLIDGGHFCTEDPVIDMLISELKYRFDTIPIMKSKVHRQIIQFF